MGKTWSSGTKLCLPFGVNVNLNLSLDPFYTENSCPGKEGQPPSQVQFSERLWKKSSAFARSKSARACSGCLASAKLTWLSEPKCLFGKHLERLVG